MSSAGLSCDGGMGGEQRTLARQARPRKRRPLELGSQCRAWRRSVQLPVQLPCHTGGRPLSTMQHPQLPVSDLAWTSVIITQVVDHEQIYHSSL